MDDELERMKEETLNLVGMYTFINGTMGPNGEISAASLKPFLDGKDPVEVIIGLTNIITGLLADAGEDLEPLQRVAIALS